MKTTDTTDDQSVMDMAQLEALMNEKAAAIFQLCDREQKGFLTKADMRRLETDLPLSAEQLEQVFDSLDVTGNGFLTKSEFASGFGHFLGLTVCEDSQDSSQLQSLVYEYEADDNDASEQFDDLMRNLGAVGLLENEDVIKSIWMRLRHQPQLLDNFETLLRRLTSQLQRSHVDYFALQKTFRANCWEHDEEMMQLYEEMEQHIISEKQRIEEEEKMKENRLKEFMEQQLENKDKQLEKLVGRQRELEQKLAELKQQQKQTREENKRLIKEKEQMEERLESSGESHLVLTTSHHGLSEWDVRSLAAVQIVDWIELERENLVRQLHLLRDTNRELQDFHDETVRDLRHRRFKLNPLTAESTDDVRRASISDELSLNADSRLQPIGSIETMDTHYHQLDDDCQTTSAADHVFKIVFVGDSGVGKTCFIYRFCRNSFRKNFTATIGVEYQVKNVKVDGHTVVLQLWDTAGQERYRSFTRQYFRKADGILVMYDVTSALSFHHVRHWMTSIQASVEDGAVVLILANKVDLVDEDAEPRAVSVNAGKSLADEYDALFYETSAKSGLNINASITAMTRLLQKRQIAKINEAYCLRADKSTRKCCS